jgi:hypothetical protein
MRRGTRQLDPEEGKRIATKLDQDHRANRFENMHPFGPVVVGWEMTPKKGEVS